MKFNKEKNQANKTKSVETGRQNSGKSTFQFADNRSETINQRKLQELAKNGPQAKQTAQLQAIADNYSLRQYQAIKNIKNHPIQRVHDWKAAELEEQPQTTANKVWSAVISKGKGKEKKASKGIAKRQSLANDPTPDSAINVGATNVNKGDPLPVNPRMLARQVTSWKLAKSMGLENIHAKERYAKKGRGLFKPELYGVSEYFEGGKTIEDMALENPELLRESLKNDKIQKQLSDLKVFDFISGQSDRHMGNIMIGPNNTIKGIDNDQSFPANNARQNLMNNQVNSFTIAGEVLNFNQELIDHETAASIEAMTREDLEDVFKKGAYDDNEKLSDDELEVFLTA